MIIPIKKWIRVMKFIFIFMLLTYLMAYLFQWARDSFTNRDPYREPSGNAVKVFQPAIVYDDQLPNMTDRLLFFYLVGED